MLFHDETCYQNFSSKLLFFEVNGTLFGGQLGCPAVGPGHHARPLVEKKKNFLRYLHHYHQSRRISVKFKEPFNFHENQIDMLARALSSGGSGIITTAAEAAANRREM